MAIKTEPALDTRAFRRALGHFPTGVCVVTSVVDGVSYLLEIHTSNAKFILQNGIEASK